MRREASSLLAAPGVTSPSSAYAARNACVLKYLELTMSLKSRKALVTGSTSGIGLGIARIMAMHGANIVLNGFGDVNAAKRA